MVTFRDIWAPMNVLICDPDSYARAALKHALGRVEQVQSVETAATVADATRYLLSGTGTNAIFIDPLGVGLDAGSEFIFGIRKDFPDVIFVLYVDMVGIDSNRAVFYAGQRQRFGRYFKLDKRTPLFLFEEAVYAVLRAVQFDLPASSPKVRLKRLLEERQGAGSPSVSPSAGPKDKDDTILSEIFSLNLGELRARVASLAADETLKRTAFALIEDLSRIDRIGKIDVEAAIAKARAVTESMVTPLYVKHTGEKAKPLFNMIEKLRDQGVLPPRIWSLLHTVRVVGNLSVHYQSDALDEVVPSDVGLIGMITARIIEWYIGLQD